MRLLPTVLLDVFPKSPHALALHDRYLCTMRRRAADHQFHLSCYLDDILDSAFDKIAIDEVL
jgi:hypothetical protein